MKSNSKRFIGAGLVVAAMLPLSNGARLLGAQNEFMRQSSQVRATVVDYVAKSPDRASTSNNAVYSVVEFVGDDGTRRTAVTNVASYPAPNEIGDEIDVRVHHTDADDVRVVSFAGLWFESSFYFIPGFLTLAIGIMLVWQRKKS